MPELDLHTAYNSSGDSIYNLFDKNEEGFVVPIYQREYTWEEDNINQLFDDLVQGVQELSTLNGDDVTSFLGTVIVTNLGNDEVTSITDEDRARPTAVNVIVDGQQRISTLALISIQIIDRLKTFRDALSSEEPYLTIQNHCRDLIDTLKKLHVVEVKRGSDPPNKPKIIRVEDDQWSYRGGDESYCSPVARYVATYIRDADTTLAWGAIDAASGARVRGNVELIQQWIDDVCNAHVPDTNLYNRFPVGDAIVTDRMQRYVLGFSDGEELRTIIASGETDAESQDYLASAVYQVSLLSHYLLRRCGINRLHPSNPEWGFDMFQALNSTGTPLTAMETFLPQVIQAEQTAGEDWLSSPSHSTFAEIDELFETSNTNQAKTRRTNELLSTLALVYNGDELGHKFSAQRRWLNRNYLNGITDIEDKRKFLKHCAEVASFFHSAWYMQDLSSAQIIDVVQNHEDGMLVSLLLRYLRDATSKLSAPMLVRFYSQALESDAGVEEFIEATKACAAFFTLWRSSNSTSGLDDVYRRFFKGSEQPTNVESHSWMRHPDDLSSDSLKAYFVAVLKNKGIETQENWISASQRFLQYNEVKTICRFVLFLAGHDRVADTSQPGLTLRGNIGVCPMLSLERWRGRDYRSVDHIAPQHPADMSAWDADIYIENRVHEIGNLLPLPGSVNNHIGSKSWPVKFLHYSHIGNRTEEGIKVIEEIADQRGIVLSKRAANTLSKVNYSGLAEPLLEVGIDGQWSYEKIEARSRQIKEIAWETLSEWLDM